MSKQVPLKTKNLPFEPRKIIRKTLSDQADHLTNQKIIF